MHRPLVYHVQQPGLISRIRSSGLRRTFRWQSRLAIARIRGLILPWWWGGVRHGRRFTVWSGVEVSCRRLLAGDGVALSDNVALMGGGIIELQSGVVLNRSTTIDCALSVTVGAGTLVGPRCYIVDSNHHRHHGRPLVSEEVNSRPVHIGRDVWLGYGVVVLAGVEVGDGATVAAGAVVTRSVLPGTVVAGVPARLIKRSASSVRDEIAPVRG